MAAYYNEIDPQAAAWLRELIGDGQIADGEVDERDIRDVPPDDLRYYRQLHLFAGIGGWSLALRLAGWPDDRPVLTVSCPCPSFSAAGAGRGFADERHLWPAAFWLIDQLRPPIIMGEQVEAAIAHGWLDLVCDDLEGVGYATRAIVLPAASVGAPHIRQRLWFVAESERAERGPGRSECGESARWRPHAEPTGSSNTGGVADAEHAERRPVNLHRADGRNGSDGGRAEAHGESGARGQVRSVADAEGIGQRQGRPDGGWRGEGVGPQGVRGGPADAGGELGHATQHGQQAREQQDWAIVAGAERQGGLEQSGVGPWADLVWLPCRDGKARPTQPGLLPLAHGVSGRVGLLRGAGNSIVPQVAAEVIRAYMDGEAA